MNIKTNIHIKEHTPDEEWILLSHSKSILWCNDLEYFQICIVISFKMQLPLNNVSLY